MEIKTNMQFVFEFVSEMISSSMDDIMRSFGDKTGDNGVGDKNIMFLENPIRPMR